MAKQKGKSKKEQAKPQEIQNPIEAQPAPVEPVAKDNTCKRCGFGYKLSEVIVREQKKCCPECLAPLEWGA